MIVTDERVARFVEYVIGQSIAPPYTCMGIERDGVITAGVVFNVYEGAAINVTVAGKGWTRGFIRAVGGYVFGRLGCSRITVITERPQVIDLAERLGGQVEGTMRHQFGPGRDGAMIGILKEDWRI